MKKNSNLSAAFEELQNIYDLMPKTTCHEASCSNWCCSKLESFVDEKGLFMPLPLIYSIEFLFISEYIRKKFSTTNFSKLFDFSKKSRICPFKDPDSTFCRIYEARPYSCRVFGRKVPPIFWGVEVDEKQAQAVYCKNMSVDEQNQQEEFIKHYPQSWRKLALLSVNNSPFFPWQKAMLKELTGNPDIIILAFGEFLFLTQQNIAWYKSEFVKYWQVMGEKL
ncbi:MAG: hypothetical protein ACD_79C00265G0004 [uncultured bacterium]|nr:MAG: hypothetical protein ACD_79C00265G0004 [uncultured bacterium]